MNKTSSNNSNKTFFLLAILTCMLMFSGVALADDESCIHCGMLKSKYGHSWVVIEHEGGDIEGVCSVHCAAIDMALHTDKPVVKITVADYNTKQQINVDQAYWVIGGDKMGVMTARAKWAFATKDAADNFIKTHGGKPATYEDVMKAAFSDMQADTIMIQEKRQKMKMKKN